MPRKAKSEQPEQPSKVLQFSGFKGGPDLVHRPADCGELQLPGDIPLITVAAGEVAALGEVPLDKEIILGVWH